MASSGRGGKFTQPSLRLLAGYCKCIERVSTVEALELKSNAAVRPRPSAEENSLVRKEGERKSALIANFCTNFRDGEEAEGLHSAVERNASFCWILSLHAF